jgi:hypothetical protein
MIDIETAKACPLCSYIASNHTYATIVELACLFHDTDIPPNTISVPERYVWFFNAALADFGVVQTKSKSKGRKEPLLADMGLSGTAHRRKMEKSGVTITLLQNHLPSKLTPAEEDFWVHSFASGFLEHLWNTKDTYTLEYSEPVRTRYMRRKLLRYSKSLVPGKILRKVLIVAAGKAPDFMTLMKAKEKENAALKE